MKGINADDLSVAAQGFAQDVDETTATGRHIQQATGRDGGEDGFKGGHSVIRYSIA